MYKGVNEPQLVKRLECLEKRVRLRNYIWWPQAGQSLGIQITIEIYVFIRLFG